MFLLPLKYQKGKKCWKD